MFNESERISLRIYYNRSDCTDLYHNHKTSFLLCVEDYYNDNFDAKKKKKKKNVPLINIFLEDHIEICIITIYR